MGVRVRLRIDFHGVMVVRERVAELVFILVGFWRVKPILVVSKVGTNIPLLVHRIVSPLTVAILPHLLDVLAGNTSPLAVAWSFDRLLPIKNLDVAGVAWTPLSVRTINFGMSLQPSDPR